MRAPGPERAPPCGGPGAVSGGAAAHGLAPWPRFPEPHPQRRLRTRCRHLSVPKRFDSRQARAAAAAVPPAGPAGTSCALPSAAGEMPVKALAGFVIGLFIRGECGDFVHFRYKSCQVYDLQVFLPVQSVACFFILVTGLCSEQKFFILMRSNLLTF